MSALLSDFRYAARKLIGTPGFTVVAVLILAIAIGASTAVFSIVNGVLLKPLPYAAPDRLVRVGSIREPGSRLTAMSYADFADYRSQSHDVATMSLIDIATRNLTAAGADPLRLSVARVNANFFSILGVHPALGRGFVAGEDQPAASPTMVLSDHLWRTRFGGDRNIVGRTIDIDNVATTVIGVAPAVVSYPANVDAWLAFVPQPFEVDPDNRGAHFLGGIGRLAPSATVDAAARELQTIAGRLAARYPQTDAEFGAGAVELREQLVGNVRPALHLILGCVGCLLLIACANIANLLLVRAAGRQTEIAVRTALGASRGNLIRQLVTESLLLSVVSTIAGVGLAAGALAWIRNAGINGVPRLNEVSFDGAVFAFAASVALATGVLFGLVPAIHAARVDLAGMLKSARGAAGARGSQRVRTGLVVAEIGLALVLLVGAGLLTRSFMQLMSVDNGFHPDHVVTMSVSLPGARYPWDRQARTFADDLLARVRELPGVQSAAVSFGRPLDQQTMRITFNREDRPPTPPGKPDVSDMHMTTPDYFRTMGVRLLSGRLFNAADRPGYPLVFVISQEFAHRYFPNENPLGKHVDFGWTRDTSAANQNVPTNGEIIGVVADVKQNGPTSEPAAAIYMNFDQLPMSDISLLIRSSDDPRQMIAGARAAIKALDPQLPLYHVETMDAAVSETVAQPRFYATLLGIFAGIAVLLAGLGIYGVIAYSVSQRTREMGIRMALGAGRGGVIGLVLRQGVVVIVAGLAVGLVAAAALAHLTTSLLFGVHAFDPITFVTVPLVLLAVALAATAIPARRAAGVDPLVAMRAE